VIPSHGWDPLGSQNLQIVVNQVAIGKHFAAFLTIDGTLYTWGLNDYGQLGTGDNNSRLIPSKNSYFAEKKLFIVKVALGLNFAVALEESGRVYRWGQN
jgi:alpha-tubulin suppressor-like RCC1 family protein